MSNQPNRDAFDEAIANMIASTSSHHREYVFYAHMLSQCRIVFDEKLGSEENPKAIAVNFQHDHYNLYINPDEFSKYSLEQRIGMLKRQMLYILNDHTNRGDDYDSSKFATAAECANNQHINKDHLHDGAVTPETLVTKNGIGANSNCTTEQYYEMIPDENDSPDGSGNPPPGQGNSSPDDNSKWQESQGEEVIQKDLTKKMMEKANSETIKARGDTPSQFSDWLELFNTDKKVDWKKVLRRITGNKKANTRKTLMRPDRRNPEFAHIKGKTKDRIFTLLTIGDESGSVSDKELTSAIVETIHLCKSMNVNTRYIAVDTKAHPSVELKATTKTFERQANGGTYISGSIQQAEDENLKYDAMLVITDGYLCESDVQAFVDVNKPTIFLITSQGEIMDSMNQGKCRAIQLEPDEFD